MAKYFSLLCVVALALACDRNEPNMPAAAAEDDSRRVEDNDRRATAPIGEPARPMAPNNDPSGVAVAPERPAIADTDLKQRNAEIERATGADRDNDVAADRDRAATRDVDNTARNERDQNADTQTPLDQGNGENDLRITQEIRQAIVDRDGLSFNAKNVKVITEAGRVTLRGPVESAQERRVIGQIATKAAGAGRVDNELEIETNP